MPDELADAIYEMSAGDRDIALANWDAAGPEYQQLLVAYINLAWFGRPGGSDAAWQRCS